MQILKEVWTKEIDQPETMNTYQYVLDLRDRLEKTCKLAQEQLAKSKVKYKAYYDKRAKPRQYNVGDEVLLLLPTDHNKLLMHWRGPFPIVAKKSTMDYTIDFGHRQKTFHINMLKKYIRRDDRPKVKIPEITVTTVDHMVTNVMQIQDVVSEDKTTIKILAPEFMFIACTSVIEDEPEAYEFETDSDDLIRSKKELIHLPTISP